MNMLRTLFFLLMFGALGYLGWLTYEMQQSQRSLVDQLICMDSKLQSLGIRMPLCTDKDGATKKFAQSWGGLQKELQDTVVQIFVNKSEISILEPYRVPEQTQSLGSGFFISESGEIVTNAHVANQASSLLIQIPSFGKRQFEADLVGIMPEKDFALLKLRDTDIEFIKNSLGRFPVLSLGDSDQIARADEVMALGYPLGQQSLKSTTGVISGREGGMVQMSAAINPGNSGGPT